MESEKKWYVIHTYSGYENKVKMNLEKKVTSLGMEDKIFNVVVPMEEEVEITKKENASTGKIEETKKVVKKKIFPGYVLVEMIVDERSWYIVRNTPGVTGFVGSSTKPIPLTDAEVKRILRTLEEEKVRPVFEVGQFIHINTGSFENFPATIVSVDPEKEKIKALVNMFGREVAVELDFDQVEKID